MIDKIMVAISRFPSTIIYREETEVILFVVLGEHRTCPIISLRNTVRSVELNAAVRCATDSKRSITSNGQNNAKKVCYRYLRNFITILFFL